VRRLGCHRPGLDNSHAHYIQASNDFQNTAEENLAWAERYRLYLLVMKNGRRQNWHLCKETSVGVLGEEHSDSLTSMANLASTFWNQGQWKEAEELEVQVMETSSKCLGRRIPLR